MAKDSRLYGQFTLDFPDHEKVAILSDSAFRMLVEMTLYSRRMLTDGRVSIRLAHAKWSQSAAEELLSNDDDKTSIYIDGGDYVIHDFAEHQTTKADIEAMREKKRAAGRKGGLAKSKNGESPASTSKSLAGAKQVPGGVPGSASPVLEPARASLARSNEKDGENHPKNDLAEPENAPSTTKSASSTQSPDQQLLAGAKQSASTCLAEPLAKPSQRQRQRQRQYKGGTEISNSTTAREQESGHAPQPNSLDDLAARFAGEQTQKQRGICPRHPNGNPTGEPCRMCGEAKTEQAEDAQAKKQARRAAIDECDLCDGNGMRYTNGQARRCNHKPNTPPF